MSREEWFAGLRKKRLTAWLCAAAALAVCGCVSRRTADSGRGAGFEIGGTTRRDVMKQWGNPDDIRGDVWIWKDWETLGGKFKLGYWGIGFTVADAKMATVEHRLRFDRGGVLVSKEEVRSLPGETEWSTLPW